MTRLTLTVAALLAATTTFAIAADPAKDAKKATTPAAAQPEMQLPPGMTAEDMQACMEAGAPGKMHEHLQAAVGTWNGKSTMWMTPAAPPMKSECVGTFSPMMDGRFVKCEMTGDMPGMGPFNGFALYGYDNVAKEFQCSWIDNCGTGMMIGKGELSSDGKTLTWSFTYNCPITKKPTTMREIEKITGDNTRSLEMFGIDPKSGKEFKMMEIHFTRAAASSSAR